MPGVVGPAKAQVQGGIPDPHETPQPGEQLAFGGIAAVMSMSSGRPSPSTAVNRATPQVGAYGSGQTPRAVTPSWLTKCATLTGATLP